MERQELLNIQAQMFVEAKALMEQRNIKYAKPDDALMNFRRSGLEGITAILENKLSRLMALAKDNRDLADESFRDTILDGINYFVLFYVVEEELRLKEKV